MKRILVLLMVLVGISLAFAQQVKIGYVNTDRILAGSNEAAEIARLYDLDRTGWMNQIRALNEDIKQMERNYEIDKLTKSESAKSEALAKIDAKKAEAGQKLEEFFGEGGRAEQRYKELIEPLTVKINEVIKKISEDERYTLILDVSMGSVLYAAPSMDVTDQVLAELNKGTQKPQIDEPKLNDTIPQEESDKPFFPDDKEQELKP
ncbi:MAG: OmpH family outer membrane protein [Candidatus Cloacimonadaceae bacterium]